jgi:RND family efflux transporter MFP subunit
MKFFQIAVATLLSSALLTACSEPPPPQQDYVRPVKSELVALSSASQTHVYPGQTRAAEEVTLSFQVPGQLNKLPALAGQIIAKGQLLAELDNRDYTSLLKAAQAELDKAESDYVRTKTLLDRKLVSVAEFDQRKAARDIAEANVEQATKALADTRLTAPFAGRVAQRLVENYQDISAKEPIVTLQSNAGARIVVNIPETQLLERDEDLEAYSFTATFSNFPDQVFAVEFYEFSSVSNPTTQTYEVSFTLKETPEFIVLSGMTVSVAMTRPLAGQETRFWLPVSAVFSDPAGLDQQYVWLVQEDETNTTVVQQPVTVGRLSNNAIEILSGVTAGQRIVTAGVHFLQDGDKVRVDGGALAL